MARAATGVAAGGQAAGPVETTADEELARLREWFPDWHVWYVLRVVGHTVWCARCGTVLLNEDSPGHLAEAIGQAEAKAGQR